MGCVLKRFAYAVILIGISGAGHGAELKFNTQDFAPFNYQIDGVVSGPAAEMIRKGRFDQVFFVDLPDATEREALLAIHLERQAADPGAFDLAALVRDTDGWNAAEIEQAVVAARTVGLHENRPFTSADLRAVARKMVPLSRTMSEQIKALRDWAWDRATPASSGKGTDAVSLDDGEFA